MSVRGIGYKILVILKEFFFRKKTLNYILWIIVITIIAELKAISSYEAIGVFLSQLAVDNDSKVFDYLILVADILFNKGSYFVLLTLILLLLAIAFLKYKEIISTGVLTSEIVKKNKNLFKIASDIRAYKKLSEKDYSTFINNVTDQGIRVKIERYYSFERKRGNIYELEAYVKESNLIEELTRIKF